MTALVGGLLAIGLAFPSAAAPAATGDDTFQMVEVRPGDTLWSIANKYLKDPTKWDQILNHNRLPSKDPTVALPGMILRIPVHIIKESMRAASLRQMRNEVLFRRRQTVKWEAAQEKMQLFQGDVLRTLADATAVVEFLNKETLGLNANSMAVIKPADKAYDIELSKGSIIATNAVIHTPGATITPLTKDSRYMASVREDKSTVLAVFQGRASVMAQNKKVVVEAGKATEILMGMAPSVPVNIADMPDANIRAAQMSEAAALLGWKPPAEAVRPPPRAADAPMAKASRMEDITEDFQKIKVGTHVSAYRVQFARGEDFAEPLFDKYYEADVQFDIAALDLPPGMYWGRIAIVDLLGSEGRFSAPKQYTLGRAAGRPQR